MSIRISVAAVELERGVDRVAGRPRELGDDHPLGPEERVDQRRLADVRAPDDRHPRRGRPRSSSAAARRDRGRAARARDEAVEQVAGAAAVRGRDGDRLAEPERVQLGDQRLVARPSRPCSRPRPRAARRGAGSRRPRRRPGAARRARRAPARPRRRRRSPRAPAPGPRARASRSPRGRRRRCRSARTAARSTRTSSALRSRVTPASACTTASRPPTEPVDQGRLADVGKADDRDPRQPSGRASRQPALARELDHAARPPASSVERRSCRARPRRRRPAARRARARGRARSRSACAASTSRRRLAGLRRAAAGPLLVAGDEEDLQRRRPG